MDAVFYITLNLRTAAGFENFGRFEIGCSREEAYALFGRLQGTTEACETDTLTMELMETKDGLPLNLKILSCSLDQVAMNCRLLTREIFTLRNLK